jgi:hypothetical protein
VLEELGRARKYVIFITSISILKGFLSSAWAKQGSDSIRPFNWSKACCYNGVQTHLTPFLSKSCNGLVTIEKFFRNLQ